MREQMVKLSDLRLQVLEIAIEWYKNEFLREEIEISA